MTQSQTKKKTEPSCKQWLRWGDLVLFAMIALITLILFVVPSLSGRGGVSQAEIWIGGRLDRVITAEDCRETNTFSLSVGSYRYRVECDSGRIRVAEANCPDQVCVHTGWISHPGQAVACVPGGVLIKLIGTIDAQAGPSVDFVVR